MTAEGSDRARVGRGVDEPTTREPRTPRSVALGHRTEALLSACCRRGQAGRAGSKGPCRPRPPESPVPTNTAWIALPDVATRNGTETRTTGRADEIKNRHRFLPGATITRGIRINRRMLRSNGQSHEHAGPDPLASECAGDAREPDSEGNEVLRMVFEQQGHPYDRDKGEKHDAQCLPPAAATTCGAEQRNETREQRNPACVAQIDRRGHGAGIKRPAIDLYVRIRTPRSQCVLSGEWHRMTNSAQRGKSARDERPERRGCREGLVEELE